MSSHQGTATRNDPVEAFFAAIESERRDMFTTLPGEVVSYDAARQKATIKPRLMQTIGDNQVQAPDLIEVPVMHPRATGFIVHAPLKAGDEVMLHFAMRSLDQSAEDASNVDGYPARMHDISDAVAVPASYSKPKETTGLPADRAHIGTPDGKKGMQITEAGQVALVGGPDGGEKLVVDKDTGKVDLKANGESLTAILDDFMTAFLSHMNGAASLDVGSIATVTAIKARLTALRI